MAHFASYQNRISSLLFLDKNESIIVLSDDENEIHYRGTYSLYNLGNEGSKKECRLVLFIRFLHAESVNINGPILMNGHFYSKSLN